MEQVFHPQSQAQQWVEQVEEAVVHTLLPTQEVPQLLVVQQVMLKITTRLVAGLVEPQILAVVVAVLVVTGVLVALVVLV